MASKSNSITFDGHRWRWTRTAVTLPRVMWAGEAHNYITFGHKCEPSAAGAILTEWRTAVGFDDEKNESVYARPIKCTGHSLTNFMYSGSRGYLYTNGRVYTRMFKRAK